MAVGRQIVLNEPTRQPMALTVPTHGIQSRISFSAMKPLVLQPQMEALGQTPGITRHSRLQPMTSTHTSTRKVSLPLT
jgi:hypothetical protein